MIFGEKRGVSYLHIKELFLLLYLFTAVLEDFRSCKIPNWWILFGFSVGLLSLLEKDVQLHLYYITGWFLPFFLLILFYMIRVLGAGDIKLLMVVGLFLGRREILQVIAWSFFFGGIYALIKLIRGKCFRQRFTYFFSYLRRVAVKGKAESYVTGDWTEEMVVHFSLCIFLGCLPVIGGVL